MKQRDFWSRLIADNRAGERRGIPSWCTAHPQTLSAVLAAYRDNDEPILIEATCNQVNHEGGYTGMTPADFRRFIEGLARGAGVDPDRVILGGDHLGPNPWKRLPAKEAMARAGDMVKAFVEAGFAKIHLDASMACGDETRVSEEAIAERGADLFAAAEAAGPGGDRVYVIGTEVPIPGGELGELDALAVTRPEAAHRTLELHRHAFAKRGVAHALDKVVALVVQPGVDMGNTQVFGYDKAKAAPLSEALDGIPGIVYEAHSTDFQSEAALSDLVATHFAILKVGPSLTFAFREAAFALAEIDQRMGSRHPSHIVETLERVMDERPEHWRGYVAKGADERLLRLYGLSDRVRYYWPEPDVQASLSRLFHSVDAFRVAPGLVSQFVGEMLLDRAEPTLSQRVIAAKVGAVVAKYRRASASDPERSARF
jgi:D-tagatose-1,6-bisphosphate aldolase subunit GatZ/KbaZ